MTRMSIAPSASSSADLATFETPPPGVLDGRAGGASVRRRVVWAARPPGSAPARRADLPVFARGRADRRARAGPRRHRGRSRAPRDVRPRLPGRGPDADRSRACANSGRSRPGLGASARSTCGRTTAESSRWPPAAARPPTGSGSGRSTPRPMPAGTDMASAVTAAATQAALDAGRRFVFLFTDLANPTSNKIYQAIGYEPVIDVDLIRFEGRRSRAGGRRRVTGAPAATRRDQRSRRTSSRMSSP